jgi:26S proteasome regulatory subunit T5
MKSETQRLTHEQSHMTEKIKDNTDKIENNRQLPYLVGMSSICDNLIPGNVIEILDMDTADGAEEEGYLPRYRYILTIGANVDLNDIRAGKSAVIKTSTRQTIFLPIIGLVDPDKLKPADLIGLNKDSYLVLDTIPAEYDSRVKAMEVDEKPTEVYGDIGGLNQQIEELVEAVVLPMQQQEKFKTLGIKPPKGILLIYRINNRRTHVWSTGNRKDTSCQSMCRPK